MYDSQEEIRKFIRYIDVAYCAGIVDGEGCLYVGYNPKSQSTSMHLIVGMSDEGPLLSLQKTFGPFDSKVSPLNKQGKLHYRWVLCSENAYHAVKEMLPFLQAKKEQAKLFLGFYEVWASTKYKQGRDWSVLNLLAQKLRSLKEVPNFLGEVQSPAETNREDSLETEGCDSPSCIDGKDAESTEMIDRLN